ncbi:MAG: 16S rRNA (adenine(1518)-N(6)/adenine(1519)-N(6))-dimethyltransferase RsmA [Myxococcota bacterium]
MSLPDIDVVALLERHQLRTKKGLGQCFLHDPAVIRRIGEAAASDQTAVVEIGAGLGPLTRALAATGARVVSIERDPVLLPILRDLFRGAPNVSFVEADATTVRFAELIPDVRRPAIAGNLPYSVSSPLLLAFLEQRAELGPATVMLQREVAARIAAAEGSKTYGSLSVLFGLFAEVETLFDVGPGAFVPPPSVWSRVIRIRWRDTPAAAVPDFVMFERVLRAAFNQRRKTLRNALSAQFPKPLVEAAAAEAKIALERRAETLAVEEFAALAAAIGAALKA